MRDHPLLQVQGGINGLTLDERHRQYAILRLEGLTHIETEAVMVAANWYTRQLIRRPPSYEMQSHAFAVIRAYLNGPFEVPSDPGSETESGTHAYSDITSMSVTQAPTLSDIVDFAIEPQCDDYSPFTPPQERMKRIFTFELDSPDLRSPMRDNNPNADADA